MTAGTIPIIVLLADPSDLTRAGLRTLLHNDGRFLVIGETTSDPAALAEQLQPDLIILDPFCGIDLDLRVIDDLCHVAPQSLAVILTAAFEPRTFMAAMLKQVHGYLLKDFAAHGNRLLDVLALIARSCVVVIGPTIAERFWSYPATPVAVQLPGPNLPSLTGRELAILEKLAAGLSEQQAAAAEGISVSTARRAVAELQAKLDAPSLFTLALRASQLGLIH